MEVVFFKGSTKVAKLVVKSSMKGEFAKKIDLAAIAGRIESMVGADGHRIYYTNNEVIY